MFRMIMRRHHFIPSPKDTNEQKKKRKAVFLGFQIVSCRVSVSERRDA